MGDTSEDASFHWLDYVIFSAVLLISAVIGLFAACKHRNATAEQVSLHIFFSSFIQLNHSVTTCVMLRKNGCMNVCIAQSVKL